MTHLTINESNNQSKTLKVIKEVEETLSEKYIARDIIDNVSTQNKAARGKLYRVVLWSCKMKKN